MLRIFLRFCPRMTVCSTCLGTMLSFSGCGVTPPHRYVLLATTTSTQDSGLLEELLVPGSSFREWVDEALSPTTLVALEKATDEALHKVMLLLRSAKYLASGRDSLGIPPPELYTKEAARVMGELFELVSLAVAKGTGVVMARRIVRRVLSEAQ